MLFSSTHPLCFLLTPTSSYSSQMRSLEHTCTCCREMSTSERTVRLICPDSTEVDFTYEHINTCGCLKTECTAAGHAASPGVLKSSRRRRWESDHITPPYRTKSMAYSFLFVLSETPTYYILFGSHQVCWNTNLYIVSQLCDVIVGFDYCHFRFFFIMCNN